MRVAVLGSAGGSSFAEVARACRHVDFQVLTDRPCGLEEKAQALGIAHHRIEGETNALFSERAAAWFARQATFDFVIMFFSRMVTAPLLGAVSLLNVHPSLLPAFKGRRAVKQAFDAGVPHLGSTLHGIDSSMDGGPIIAQACSPVGHGRSLPTMARVSFLQKTALFFLAIELVETGMLRFTAGRPLLDPAATAGSARLNPALTNPAYLQAMSRLQAEVGLPYP